MPAKRYSVEPIVANLRETERRQGQGLTIPQTCERLGISDQTFYRWRIKYGALKEDEAQRLKALELAVSRTRFDALFYGSTIGSYAFFEAVQRDLMTALRQADRPLVRLASEAL
jgi:putative transposase